MTTPLKSTQGLAMALLETLFLEKCPHCKITNPNITKLTPVLYKNDALGERQIWRLYCCASCGSGILAKGENFLFEGAQKTYVTKIFPQPPRAISKDIPKLAQDYLTEARDGLSNSRSSIIASSTAIDAMLSAKGADGDTLYKRIKSAQEKNLLSEEMSKWAHQVRLGGNEQRHLVDERPTEKDAQDCLDYAMMLADILFVIPARVQAGIDKTKKETTDEEGEKNG
ncbi:MAG: DUF4145 domain-containing protein [Rhodobiaceae bacterium]|jgi:hypothetical protein|nr:DUF4145 domain-containing protein [Rhodobiaceae bacterium]